MSAMSTFAATVIACTSMPFVQGNVLLKGKLSVAAQVESEARFIALERELLAEAAAREEAAGSVEPEPRRLRGAKSNGRSLRVSWKTLRQVKEATNAAHSLYNFSNVIRAAEEEGAQFDVEGFVARLETVLVEHFGKETAESLGQELEKYLDNEDEEGSGRRLATTQEAKHDMRAKLLKKHLPITTLVVYYSYKLLSTKFGRDLLWNAPEIVGHFFLTMRCLAYDSTSTLGGDYSALASGGQYEADGCAELFKN